MTRDHTVPDLASQQLALCFQFNVVRVVPFAKHRTTRDQDAAPFVTLCEQGELKKRGVELQSEIEQNTLVRSKLSVGCDTLHSSKFLSTPNEKANFQATIFMETPKTIDQPELWIQPRKETIGRTYHVLQNAQSTGATDLGEIKVSARRTERLVQLGDQRILLTKRKSIPIPPEANITGVLQLVDNKFRWQHHLHKSTIEQLDNTKFAEHVQKTALSWPNRTTFQSEQRDKTGAVTQIGLRPPQIGALHAIGAHWSLYNTPATIVMPTGTGKTETMLACLTTFLKGPLFVVVPSQALRDQTTDKFKTLGLLRKLGVIPFNTPNPVVAVIKKRPKNEADLDIFKRANVLVATIACLAQIDDAILTRVAEQTEALIIDEAHHAPAKSWKKVRKAFVKKQRKVLQFTATPFRRDGRVVDGEVIYSYPLHRAQQDGYFKPINFKPVYEIESEEADGEIARLALETLETDLAGGSDHVLMARCQTISRATAVHKIYEGLASTHKPVLVHSEEPNTQEHLKSLRAGKSKIVVCVDMLGEGFDLPQLKIAAIHDVHKSLAVLLQFTGRFTRSGTANIGEATVIANIAQVELHEALERLYSEDADWNLLLNESSSKAVREHEELVKFLKDSERLDQPIAEDTIEISPRILRPRLSTAVYECPTFKPTRFYKGLPRGFSVHASWHNKKTNTLYFVTRRHNLVRWSRSKQIKDHQWDLFILHYDPSTKLLYLNSSDTKSLHSPLAEEVGANKNGLINGDKIFRVLGRIKRLIFQNIGVKKPGRRNLSYSLHTGSDVKRALNLTNTTTSIKSNLFGNGYEAGHPVNIGCSQKGRIWSRTQGPISTLLDWCHAVGDKLLDDSIDTSNVLENVLVPEKITSFPNKQPLSIDWPIEIHSYEHAALHYKDTQESIMLFELRLDEIKTVKNQALFTISSEHVVAQFTSELTVDGYEMTQVKGPKMEISLGRFGTQTLVAYFTDYPPLIRFIDLSELDGDLYIKFETDKDWVIPSDRFEIWGWNGVDITKESIWNSATQRPNSVQGHTAAEYQAKGYTVIFDDDASGESADLVCLREDADEIRLALLHCKFSADATPGARLDDVVVVCSQALRSVKWTWDLPRLMRQILGREKRLKKPYRLTRFLNGDAAKLKQISKVGRFKPLKIEIAIVQPGLSKSKCTIEQAKVLAAADAFLLDTVNIPLTIICSA